MADLGSFTITGLTVFFTSVTSPAAEMMTVPGEKTFSSPYFWVIDKESLPVGMLIPKEQAKSLQASTALYKRASSPGFLQGHIQLALSETESKPSFNGAQTILVRASAIASTEPASGLAKAASGACPIEVEIPALPR
ncbi:hypothetical protein SDC9_126916 [bioreactor metagenome]|uniref:Uncharacterized protein n=1 Tax=bioreactor metagenome TaxID=1076179 RepID=A0A645CSK0_9ZZZZ